MSMCISCDPVTHVQCRACGGAGVVTHVHAVLSTIHVICDYVIVLLWYAVRSTVPRTVMRSKCIPSTSSFAKVRWEIAPAVMWYISEEKKIELKQ